MSWQHNSLPTIGRTIAFALSLTVLVVQNAIAQNYRIERIASGLNQPTYVTQAPNDPANILYYTERTKDANPGFGASNDMGRVWRYDVSTRTRTLVLDLSSRSVTNDTGLQTVAFHPDFNTPATPGYGKLYVSSSQSGTTALNRVEEYNVDLGGPNPSYAATFSRTLLQYQNNAQNNHTVDWIGFDPTSAGAERNYLYISTGDGSFGNSYNGGISPTGRPSQNPSDVAGKMLRVDVVGADAYPGDPLKNFAIPSSNPIPTYNAAHPGSPITGFGEVYLTGLRNVYRASFDRANGDLWMGDVGETSVEEVSFLKQGTNVSGPPVDYGWPQKEGTFDSSVPSAPHTLTNPFTGAASLGPLQQFSHTAGGNAVIGGYVYHGPVAELQGKYFYSDFVRAGQIWSLNFDRNTPTANYNGSNGTNADLTAQWQSLVFDPTDPSYVPDSTTASSAGIDHIVSFGEDNAGNMYIVDFGNGSGFDGQYPGAGLGEIFRIVPIVNFKVTVNRSTGQLTFSNDTGAISDISGYSLVSSSGAIEPGEITPITGRLDAPPGGNGSIDPTNHWTITSAPGSHNQFSEASTGGAASLSIGEQFVLSPADGWIRSIYEDFQLSVVLGDGTEVPATVEFIGNGGQSFARSDLNFNGDLDPADWPLFRTHHLQNLSGLSKAQAYQLGDLDGDGDNDFADFRLFQADYIAANGAAAFAALLNVPEPSSIVLLVGLAAAVPMVYRRRSPIERWRYGKRCAGRGGIYRLPAIVVLTMAVGLFTSSAHAVLTHRYTFNYGTASDSVGNSDGTLQGNASVSGGLLNLPGGANDFVSLLASGPNGININTYVDATFEAWFTTTNNGASRNWQRVFDFGDSNGSSGSDYIFYTPRATSTNARAAIRDGTLTENQANHPILSANTPYHIVVVVDDNANGGNNRMTVYQNGAVSGTGVALSYSLSDLSNNFAYLGESLFASADPNFIGSMDEFRIYNNAFTAAEALNSFNTGPTPGNSLKLEVNVVTGRATIKNPLPAVPLDIDYYRVTSAAGALNTTTWNSLADQNVGAIGPGEGQSWDEAEASNSTQLAELFLLGSTNVASGSLQLGHPFNPSILGPGVNGDLQFQFGIAGEGLIAGTVTYVTAGPLAGDYNHNGTVDGADDVIWRNTLGSTSVLDADGDSDGVVDQYDYLVWKATFGNSAGTGSAIQPSTVPEPTTALLVVIGCTSLIAIHRGRGH